MPDKGVRTFAIGPVCDKIDKLKMPIKSTLFILGRMCGRANVPAVQGITLFEGQREPNDLHMTPTSTKHFFS